MIEMSMWLEITVAAIILVVLILVAGAPSIFWLAKSFAEIVVEAKEKNWQRDDIARLLRKGALYVSVVVFISLLPWSFMIATVGGMADQFFRTTLLKYGKEAMLKYRF